MRALIACEYSRIVSEQFEFLGWDVTSCDLLPAEKPGKHYMGDVFDIIGNGFDLMIAHPPCTYLTVAGNRHIPSNVERWEKRLEALKFVYNLMNVNIKHIAIENPIGVISSYIRKPEQIVQPYYWGDNIPKSTCLWIKNLPLLTWDQSTYVEPEYIEYNSKKNKSGKSKYSVFGKLGKGHGHERSRFFPGMAKAMAEQWTAYIKAENEISDISFTDFRSTGSYPTIRDI